MDGYGKTLINYSLVMFKREEMDGGQFSNSQSDILLIENRTYRCET